MSPIDAHVRAWLRAVGSLPGGRVQERDGALWARTPIDWPLFNGGTGSAAEAALDDLRRHGRPFFWWGDGGGGSLVADGPLSWEQAPRSALPEPALPPGLRLEEVRDEAGQRTWARTLRDAHGFPAAAERAWLQAGQLTGWSELPWRMWTAFDDNDPVGAGLLFCGGGVASPVAVGVTEDHRKRGIGRALTLALVHEAGEDTAGCLANEQGSRLYRSLGFRPRGRITRWLWAPDPLEFTLRRGSTGAARQR